MCSILSIWHKISSIFLTWLNSFSFCLNLTWVASNFLKLDFEFIQNLTIQLRTFPILYNLTKVYFLNLFELDFICFKFHTLYISLEISSPFIFFLVNFLFLLKNLVERLLIGMHGKLGYITLLALRFACEKRANIQNKHFATWKIASLCVHRVCDACESPKTMDRTAPL